ncbi:hypothetical protein M2352_000369 [Azospirillum fermentarium]|uniref:hypothetical protein n=1 Tax=Azospirillum fermentarium TaxID=1233114 RepID=UPI002225CF43|nr:hypothetical protein [Azospirillum fermentarium]MCW2244778.1 hypothetical protein [Azospirillum fermentarium]
MEWIGSSEESLPDILEKKIRHDLPTGGALHSHLVSTPKKSSFIEVLSLWMGYSGVPDTIRDSPAFITFLSVITLALLSPRHFKLVPDSAGEVLDVFEMKGFDRILSKKKLHEYIKDYKVVMDGIQFLIDRKMIEPHGENYRLLVTPLTNIKIKFL